MIENILRDVCKHYALVSLFIQTVLVVVVAAKSKNGAAWRIAILRYFNPIGAHPSGLIGFFFLCFSLLRSLTVAEFAREQARTPRERPTIYCRTLRKLLLVSFPISTSLEMTMIPRMELVSHIRTAVAFS
jgi:hypothetical protein